MVAWTFSAAGRRGQKLSDAAGLGAELLAISGGGLHTQTSRQTPMKSDAVACIADEGDDFEMAIESARSMIGAGDRIIGFAIGAAAVAAVGAIWMLA